MTTAIVDGNSRRWKARVSKPTHGDADKMIAAVFCMEDVSPTYRAEPEYEPRSLITDTTIFGG
jgi:hypothetical protein